jgi:hypothetical protein
MKSGRRKPKVVSNEESKGFATQSVQLSALSTDLMDEYISRVHIEQRK